jgi:hypothetical protein
MQSDRICHVLVLASLPGSVNLSSVESLIANGRQFFTSSL